MDNKNIRNLAFPENAEAPGEEHGQTCNFILVDNSKDKPRLPAVRKPTVPRLRDIDLPDGLRRRTVKQYLSAGAVALFFIWVSLAFHRPSCLAGLAISAALVLSGVMMTLDYAAGRISEVPVICASVTTGALRNTTHVVFRTQGEMPAYFEFFVPGRVRNAFQPNYAYVIYFRADAPNSLLGYVQL